MRLAFSVASHLDPEVLLIDEALTGGDTKFQMKTTEKMYELCGGGRTIVLVTHGLSWIRSMATTALWLHQGRVVEIRRSRRSGGEVHALLPARGELARVGQPVRSIFAGADAARSRTRDGLWERPVPDQPNGFDGSEEPSPLGAAATLPAGPAPRRAGEVGPPPLQVPGAARRSSLIIVIVVLLAFVPAIRLRPQEDATRPRRHQLRRWSDRRFALPAHRAARPRALLQRHVRPAVPLPLRPAGVHRLQDQGRGQRLGLGLDHRAVEGPRADRLPGRRRTSS